MTVRLRMPKGHNELNLAGVQFLPDEDGAFNVPDEHAKSLIATHGAEIEPSVETLESEADAADQQAAHAKRVHEQMLDEAKAKRAKFEKAKAKSAAAKTAADKVAADAAAAAAKAGGTPK